MGSPKQLLRYGDQTMLRHAALVALASVCRPVFVVLGAHAEQLRSEIDDLPVHLVLNEQWAEGMGSSIRAGLTALTTDDRQQATEALVLMLCDQPYVTAGVIDRLVAAYHSNDKGIMASEYDGTLGVPALFGRESFAELAALSGAGGAKTVIAAHASDVVRVPFPGGATDVDTPDDYLRLQQRAPHEDGIGNEEGDVS